MSSKKKHSLLVVSCLLGSLLLGVFAIEVVMDSAGSVVYATFSKELSSWGEPVLPQAEGGEADSSLGRMLPDHFEAELFYPAEGRELRVSDAGDVVGFLSHEPAELCFSSYADKLRSKGWIPVESGQKQAASFVKARGLYPEIFLSCTEVGDETAVVVQLVRGNL
ncbi:MAG: hypothetical protein RR671_02800 [Raoultibacter sp.]